MIFDTHTHIYLPEFDEDRNEVVKSAVDAGVTKMMLPNVDVETIEPLKNLLQQYPEYCVGAMGLHPTSVENDYKKQLQTVYNELIQGNYKAVGEVGVDLYWNAAYKTEQMDAFGEQLSWANSLSLPVIIHNRNALAETILVLKQQPVACFVMHSFGGTPDDVNKIRECGDAYFGINGVVTFKNAHLEDTVREIGLSRLLVETDAPYLTPVPFRGKRNQPAYIVNTVNKIAEILQLSAAEVAEATYNNAIELFD